jgi:hypothetical protein
MLIMHVGPCIILVSGLAPSNIIVGVRHRMDNHLLILILSGELSIWLDFATILNNFGLFRQLCLFFNPPLLVLIAHDRLIFLLSKGLPDFILSKDLGFQSLLLSLIF